MIANEKRPEISWAAEYFDKNGNYIVDNEEAEFEEIIQEHYLTEDITGKYLEGKATIRTWEIYMKEESYIHTTLTIQRVLVR